MGRSTLQVAELSLEIIICIMRRLLCSKHRPFLSPDRLLHAFSTYRTPPLKLRPSKDMFPQNADLLFPNPGNPVLGPGKVKAERSQKSTPAQRPAAKALALPARQVQRRGGAAASERLSTK